MQRTLRHTFLAALIIAVLPALDAEAQGNWRPGDFGSVRFRLGLFEPQADSKYWDDKFAGWTGSPSNFQDFIWGVDYLWRSSRRSGLLFGTSFYSGSATQAYLDYVDEFGNDISHTTTLRFWDLSFAYTYRFGGRDRSVTPYAGLGAGFINWRLEENGYFIDFADPGLPIVFARYRDDGWTFEGLGFVGLDVPLSFRWSFFLEGRYRYAGAELSGDFAAAGRLDLSGGELTAGFSYNF